MKLCILFSSAQCFGFLLFLFFFYLNLFKYNFLVQVYGRISWTSNILEGFWTVVVYPLTFMNVWMLFLFTVHCVWIFFKLCEQASYISSIPFLWLWDFPLILRLCLVLIIWTNSFLNHHGMFIFKFVHDFSSKCCSNLGRLFTRP